MTDISTEVERQAVLQHLTWANLARVKAGAWMAFKDDWRAEIGRNSHLIPAGTLVCIMENGLDKIWAGIVVSVEDEAIAKRLLYAQDEHNGCLLIERDDLEFSPFLLDESDIGDWT